MLRSRYCDHPADVVRGVHVVSRSAIPDLRGLSGEQVEAAMQAARRGGLQSAHVLDVEWLRRHRPALVLTQDTCPSCDVSEGTVHHSLDAAGLDRARAVTLNPVTVEQILASMRHLAAALGVDGSHTATAVLAPLESRLQAVAEAVPSTEQRRLRVLGLESVCPLVASGQWLPDMRVRAGGVDALGDEAGSAARRITWEEVEACGAEVIVLCCCGRSADGAAAEVRQHFLPRPGVWKLPAMAATHPRLYVVPHDLFSRPGPRVVDGVEALAGLMYPERLPAQLLAQARSVGALRLAAATATPDASAWQFEPIGVAPAAAAAAPATPGGPLLPAVRSAATLVGTDDGSVLLFGGEIEGGRETRGMGASERRLEAGWLARGAASVASFLAAVLTEIYLCNVCSCQEILRRNGRG
jgi:iron complex transport system substrate-binding protein